MFSADLKINGMLIGHLYGHNTGLDPKSPPGVYRYYIEYHSIGGAKEGFTVTSDYIAHVRKEGLERLVIKSLEVLSS